MKGFWKVEAALDPADERLVRMLLQVERTEHPIDGLDRAAQPPPCRMTSRTLPEDHAPVEERWVATVLVA